MATAEKEGAAGAAEDLAQIRILLADDHTVVRAGLIALLGSQEDMSIVGEAGDGERAVVEFQRLTPDVVLLDLQMPGVGGIEALSRIRALSPDARVIVLTTFSGDAQAAQAIQAGACGYLLKTSSRHELFAAIRHARSGVRYLDPTVERELALNANDQLTRRECDIIGLVANGRSNKEIAQSLLLAEDTIKGYLKIIFLKLGAQDRTHAVTIAARRGFISI